MSDSVRTMRRATIKAVLELLAERGMEIGYVGEPYGRVGISIDAAVLLATDRDAFDAALAGLSIANYRAYRDHDWQCRAQTKAKQRCKNFVAARQRGYVVDSNFNPKEDIFIWCEVHLGK